MEFLAAKNNISPEDMPLTQSLAISQKHHKTNIAGVIQRLVCTP